MSRKIINVVGAPLSKMAKYCAHAVAKASRWLDIGSFPEAKSNLTKARVRHCTVKSKKNCSAKLKSAAKCAPLHMITTSAPSYSQHSYATC